MPLPPRIDASGWPTDMNSEEAREYVEGRTAKVDGPDKPQKQEGGGGGESGEADLVGRRRKGDGLKQVEIDPRAALAQRQQEALDRRAPKKQDPQLGAVVAKDVFTQMSEGGGGKVPTREDVMAFLLKNPNPDDGAYHAHAEKMGWNVPKAEAMAYTLATDAVHFWMKGMANQKGVTEKDVDAKQLAAGVKVEREHTDNDDMARRIALDHLAEIPDYYTRLARMEDEAKTARKDLNDGAADFIQAGDKRPKPKKPAAKEDECDEVGAFGGDVGPGGW